MSILTWLLKQYLPNHAIMGDWADLRALPNPPRHLWNKIISAVDLHPCDLLFVHRDAENQPHNARVVEIHTALQRVIDIGHVPPPAICVVPIRMQEAWLLIDETALRMAASNPNGKIRLQLPPLNQLEKLPNPKAVLHELLRQASGLHGRRKRQFSPHQAAYRLATLIDDFSPLRYLEAFNVLEHDLINLIKEQAWDSD